MVELQENYRFAENSDIGQVSAAINRGEGSQIIEALKNRYYKNIQWSILPKARELALKLKPWIVDGFRNYLILVGAHGRLDDIFDAFDQFRVLCALRQGPFGVSAVNPVIEKILAGEGMIRPEGRFYHGQPVMITRNNNQLKLFNGDVGLILSDDQKDGELSAVFRDGSGRFRRFSPQRLPEHETVYAMTVHKSQGSEFENVLFLLSDRDAPVLTRELIYTGMTRARNQVFLWSDETVFNTSVLRRIQRSSGLQDALWQRHR
jgi:exodeoxyribonuclease V alpha subunit